MLLQSNDLTGLFNQEPMGWNDKGMIILLRPTHECSNGNSIQGIFNVTPQQWLDSRKLYISFNSTWSSG